MAALISPVGSIIGSLVISLRTVMLVSTDDMEFVPPDGLETGADFAICDDLGLNLSLHFPLPV